MVRLEFGDVSFMGCGPDRPLMVGVERKRLNDFLNSADGGRLMGHQVPGMLNAFDQVYLVVEGVWREGPEGTLEQRSGRDWRPTRGGGKAWTYNGFIGYLQTMSVILGIHVLTTRSIRETAQVIVALHKWWSRPWADHHSFQALNTVQPLGGGIIPVRPPLLRLMAAQIDGVGWKRSLAVAGYFKTIKAMAEAGEGEWLKVPGIGKGLAPKIVKQMDGGR